MKTSTVKISIDSNLQTATNRSNSIWGIIEYTAQAASLICLTPLLIRTLGDDAFGLLVIATMIMGLNGLFSLGLGPAAQHFIAKYRQAGEPQSRLKSVFETAVATNLVFGIFSCIAVVFFAKLIPWFFSEHPKESQENLTAIIRLAGFGLPFVFIVNSVDNTLRGFERFDLSVPLSALTRLITACVQILLVLLGFGVLSLVIATVALKGLQALAGIFVVKRSVLPSLGIGVGFSWEELRAFASYGVYVWMNSMIATVKNSGEMLMLAAILGPSMLTLFVVPSRVLSQTHLLLAKAFAYLFPFATKLIQSGNTQRIYEIYLNSTRYLCTLTSLAIPALAIGCGPLLAFWIDVERAEKITPVFQILAVRYSVFPLSILTSNLLMAANKTRIITIITAVTTITIVPMTGLLAYLYGVQGAAAAQVLVFAPLLFDRFIVEKTLFGKASWLTVAGPLLLMAIPLTCFLLTIRIPVEYPLLPTMIISAMVGLTCGLLSWFATTVLERHTIVG